MQAVPGAGVLCWDPWSEGTLLAGTALRAGKVVQGEPGQAAGYSKEQERGKMDLLRSTELAEDLVPEQDPCVQLNSLQPGIPKG